MKRMIFTILLGILPGVSMAAEAGITLLRAHVDLGDKPSLQRGARIFVNYCLSCHSASHMRFSRLAKDLHLADKLVMDNLMFVTDKIGNTMRVAMTAKEAQAWFGVAPPDLSVIARARGVDWLYTFLNSFYLDPTRPSGVNNLLFKDTAMPHVLWELQGWQQPIVRTRVGENGEEIKVIEGLELITPGKLSVAEYRRMVHDLVNFLAYLGEPAQLIRQRMGLGVIMFLAVFLVITYLLKKEYWKDVH